MLDIQLLRRDLDGVIARLDTRQEKQPLLDRERFTTLEAERKRIQTRTEDLQARRNALSKQIGAGTYFSESQMLDLEGEG